MKHDGFPLLFISSIIIVSFLDEEESFPQGTDLA